jgi:hypothetical protein
MENENPSSSDVKQDTTNAGGVNETAQGTKADSNDTIPRARLNEVIAKNKELDSKLQAFEKQKEIEAQKKLEEQGEYNTILSKKDAMIEELKPYKEELVKWKKEQREEILQTMTEEDQAEFGDLPYGQLKKVAKRLSPVRDVQVKEQRPSARTSEIKPFSGKAKDKDEQKKTWKERLNSYR